jgi:hypothetical protein
MDLEDKALMKETTLKKKIMVDLLTSKREMEEEIS